MLMTGESLSKAEAKLMNPVVLAFVGDAVYSLYVRNRMAVCYKGKPADFQRTAGKVVSAHSQSAFVEQISPLFTEEETEIFLRGRNAKKGAKSKNADVAEYNRSTGFEAVLGFLYVSGQTARIEELLSYAPEEFFTPQQPINAYKP
ncbi:MAG: ribonuclease III [Clostridia bacterium]|nr:ribonuclease III [Clostridia bacterium]